MLDSAATKEKEAHKRLQALQEHAELLAKEKWVTREAMQKALADLPPQPTPAPEESKAQRASSGYERIPSERSN